MQDDKPDYTLGDILNKIKSSRGAPHSIKFPKHKIAGPEDLTPEQLKLINDGLKKGKIYLTVIDEDSPRPEKSATLTSKQQDIISLLTNPENDGEDYFDDIKNAVRAGLIWHPLVYDFIDINMALGKKEILKKIKRGLETIAKRPQPINELQFKDNLEKIAKYREEGKTWPQIRRTLMKRRLIKKMSRQALQKKFKKAWKEKWKEVSKKPPPVP